MPARDTFTVTVDGAAAHARSFDAGEADEDRPSLADELADYVHPAARGLRRTGEVDAYGHAIWRRPRTGQVCPECGARPHCWHERGCSEPVDTAVTPDD